MRRLRSNYDEQMLAAMESSLGITQRHLFNDWLYYDASARQQVRQEEYVSESRRETRLTLRIIDRERNMNVSDMMTDSLNEKGVLEHAALQKELIELEAKRKFLERERKDMLQKKIELLTRLEIAERDFCAVYDALNE
jgi:hypothetical protein